MAIPLSVSRWGWLSGWRQRRHRRGDAERLDGTVGADDVVLGDAELVAIKGSAVPVQARRLLGVADHRVVHAAEVDFGGSGLGVGRRHRSVGAGHRRPRCGAGSGGCPGIGKSRLTAELSAAAAARGVEVFGTYCESHAGDIAFGVVARLLRTTTGVAGLTRPLRLAQIRAAAPMPIPGIWFLR